MVVTVEVPIKRGHKTALGGIDNYPTSTDSCLKPFDPIGKAVEKISARVDTITNKNTALPDSCIFPKILGTCAGIFVTILCGSAESDTDITAGSTDEASSDAENEVATEKARKVVNVSTVGCFSNARQ